MNFTFSSLFTTIFYNSASITILYFILKSNVIIKKAGIKVLIISMLVSILPMLMPFEFPFAKTIGISLIWPNIYRFFNKSFLTIGDISIKLISLLFTIWILGIIYLIIRKIRGYYYLFRKIEILSEANSTIKNMVQMLTLKNKKKNRFTTVVSKTVPAPMILGLLKPIIIIPDIKLSDKEWYYILSHEISHYYHGDLFIKFLLEFFTAIYWWNPFVYLLKRQTSRLLEINNDTNLIKHWSDNEKLEYIECLVKLSQKQYLAPTNNWAASFINHRAISVAQRVTLILDDIKNNKRQSNATTFFVLCVSLILIFMPIFFVIEPYSILPEHDEEAFSITPENSYYIRNDNGTFDFYLNGRYILTQKEIVDAEIIIYENEEEVPE